MRRQPAASALAGLLLCGAVPLAAQEAGPGFLFGQPTGAVALRAGVQFADARGRLFDFVAEHLTLERRDFHGPSFGVDVTWWVAPRLDAGVGIGFSRAAAWSEYRGWEDEQGLPIAQHTRLQQWPLSAIVRVYPLARGRAIGRLAWVPAPLVPFLGVAGGTTHYEFRQEGEFVDFEDEAIFEALLSSSGWGVTGQIYGGIDVRAGTATVVSAEARRVWTSAATGGDFPGFGRIGLGGVQLNVALQRRF
jgi:hypothetical protein